MTFNFSDLIDILDGEEFEEKPVDLRTFVQSPDYLGLPPLSEYQYTLIEKSSQIYKESTLIKLFGHEEGKRMFKQTANEVVAQLGKGSGKDYCATIAVSYIVYLLLCLKDPATYYGKHLETQLILLTLLLTLSRQAMFSLKDSKHVSINHLGLLESIMIRLQKLSLIKPLQYTQATQSVKHGKGIT